MDNIAGSADEIRSLLDDPLLEKALGYWESIRPCPNGLPHRADLDPMAVPALLPTVLLIDVLPDDEFVYRLGGARIEERYQIDSFAGKTPHETLGDKAENVLVPYRLVRDRKCLFYRVAPQDWLGREPSYRSYKGILLPFTADGETVDMIFGVFSFGRK